MLVQPATSPVGSVKRSVDAGGVARGGGRGDDRASTQNFKASLGADRLENGLWGARGFHGELLTLGFTLGSRSSVKTERTLLIGRRARHPDPF